MLALFDLDLDVSVVQLWTHLGTSFVPLCDAVCLSLTHNASNVSGVVDVHNASAPLPPSNCTVACGLAAEHGDERRIDARAIAARIHVNILGRCVEHARLLVARAACAGLECSWRPPPI